MAIAVAAVDSDTTSELNACVRNSHVRSELPIPRTSRKLSIVGSRGTGKIPERAPSPPGVRAIATTHATG
jgi:hypothetical protein